MITEAQITAAIEATQGPAQTMREMFCAALEAAEKAAWQPIATAPKDRTPVLLKLKILEDRSDLKDWDGITFVGRHPGICADRFDIGWNVAAPVGHGGFPDKWIACWRPLPDPPTESA